MYLRLTVIGNIFRAAYEMKLWLAVLIPPCFFDTPRPFICVLLRESLCLFVARPRVACFAGA